jgi:hypothetical protein
MVDLSQLGAFARLREKLFTRRAGNRGRISRAPTDRATSAAPRRLRLISLIAVFYAAAALI